VLAGALLAIHFGVWIPSLSYTTVAASTVLVTSQPIWVVLIGRLSGERVSRRLATGVGLSLAGAALISGGDFGVSARAAVGDLLALLGAVAAAGYYVSGRSLRQRLSLLTYVGIAYTTCAVVLGAAMLASGTAFGGFESTDWWLFGLLALGPQIMGHTVFNYLLGDVEAAVVAVAVTFEPVGASLLALAFFGEVPRWTAFAGGALILAGIYVTVAAQTRRSEVAPVQ
jgi:drug/metabolite transporter (DMT)-like permease